MRRSPRCQAAIDHAKQACSRFGHSYVSSAHLVLGLLSLNGGVGDSVLKHAGLSADLVERFLSSKRDVGEETVKQQDATFGKSAADAIVRAESDATASGHSIFGVEHLTLALLAEEKGDAADLFEASHIDRAKTRQSILEQIQ